MSERADNAQVTEAPQWYVVHTYSGYENKVMDDLGKTVENNGLQHLIYEIKVPIEEVAEIKGESAAWCSTRHIRATYWSK